MPDPSAASPKQKQRNRRLTMGLCPAEHGGVVRNLQKRQTCRSFYAHHGGVPSSARGVVNAKIYRILPNLDSIDTMLTTGPCPLDTGTCGTLC
ncbi:hypothetical protein HanRHA438_Chr04g0169241 [Helianthus annuus]|nr:hypothetical protein HanRHA438_Chr04g0169241 [Helianthus annuus]